MTTLIERAKEKNWTICHHWLDKSEYVPCDFCGKALKDNDNISFNADSQPCHMECKKKHNNNLMRYNNAIKKIKLLNKGIK
jgi:hypothetical protein